MDTQEKLELLGQLVRLQIDCAPITIQIGTTHNNRVDNECIVIKNAPPRVLGSIDMEKYYASVTENGVEITKRYA